MLDGVEIDEYVHRMGGVTSWGRLVGQFPAAQVRRAAANCRIVKIGHGLYALPQVEHALVAARSLSGVLSLTSAALHHGLAVKTPPTRPHITVPRNRKVSPQRRRGVDLHYGDISTDGIATTPLQTVIDCARVLPFDEAVSVADSALRSRMVGKGSLVVAAERSPRTGRNAALRVAHEADGRADNPFESVTRAISREFPELKLVPQVTIPGLGTPDLVDRELGLVVECDSFTFHSNRSAVVNDVERYNTVELRGLGLLRFAWEHSMLRQDYVRDTLREWLEARAASDGRAVRRPCPRCAA
jgi:hypothetical protein